MAKLAMLGDLCSGTLIYRHLYVETTSPCPNVLGKQDSNTCNSVYLMASQDLSFGIHFPV